MASENADHNNDRENGVQNPGVEQRQVDLEGTLGDFFGMISGHPQRARDREINFVQVMLDLLRENEVNVFEIEVFQNVLELIVRRWLPLEWNRRSPTPPPLPPSEPDTSSEGEIEVPVEIQVERNPRTPSVDDTSEDEYTTYEGPHEV